MTGMMANDKDDKQIFILLGHEHIFIYCIQSKIQYILNVFSFTLTIRLHTKKNRSLQFSDDPELQAFQSTYILINS